MFTAKCFIKKNTSELIAKLEQMGYVRALYEEDYNTIGLSIDQGDIFPLRIDDIPILTKELFIDCGDNMDMFLAIAALRDDTDDYQWLTNDDHTYWERKETICMPSKYMQLEGHKATVKELIEYFK